MESFKDNLVTIELDRHYIKSIKQIVAFLQHDSRGYDELERFTLKSSDAANEYLSDEVRDYLTDLANYIDSELPAKPEKETLEGPGTLRIELDPDEYFPEDPGNGTPVMVHKNDWDQSSTYHVAFEQGVLEDNRPRKYGEVELSDREMKWIDQQSKTIRDFYERCDKWRKFQE